MWRAIDWSVQERVLWRLYVDDESYAKQQQG